MVYFPVLCHVYLCLEFWHNERSFAKCAQATGKNCNTNIMHYIKWYTILVKVMIYKIMCFNCFKLHFLIVVIFNSITPPPPFNSARMHYIDQKWQERHLLYNVLSQIIAVILNFLLITEFEISVSLAANQHIRMNSERSSDTEDWSNDAEGIN